MEFMYAISVTSRGNLDEKIKWAFKIYDLDGDNNVTKTEMESILKSIALMANANPDNIGLFFNKKLAIFNSLRSHFKSITLYFEETLFESYFLSWFAAMPQS